MIKIILCRLLIAASVLSLYAMNARANPDSEKKSQTKRIASPRARVAHSESDNEEPMFNDFEKWAAINGILTVKAKAKRKAEKELKQDPKRQAVTASGIDIDSDTMEIDSDTETEPDMGVLSAPPAINSTPPKRAPANAKEEILFKYIGKGTRLSKEDEISLLELYNHPNSLTKRLRELGIPHRGKGERSNLGISTAPEKKVKTKIRQEKTKIRQEIKKTCIARDRILTEGEYDNLMETFSGSKRPRHHYTNWLRQNGILGPQTISSFAPNMPEDA